MLTSNPEYNVKFGIGIGIGLKTFQFLMVSHSVLKTFGIKTSIGFSIKQRFVKKKVSELMGFGIGNIWYPKSLGFSIKKEENSWKCLFETWLCKIWYRYWYRFETFPIFLIVSDSVSNKFGIKISIGFGIPKKNYIEKRIGFGIGNIWYQKMYRIQYQKIFGIVKSIEFDIGNI